MIGLRWFQCGLAHRADRQWFGNSEYRLSLSPGALRFAQQRVAIARAVANEPLVLLADEPTGNLDPETAGYVFETLDAVVRQSGLSTVIATHNHDLASLMNRRVTLHDGKVVEV